MTARLHTVKNLSESVRVMAQTALVRLFPKVFKINIATDGRNYVLKLQSNMCDIGTAKKMSQRILALRIWPLLLFHIKLPEERRMLFKNEWKGLPLNVDSVI